ncbi:MAG TPA: hypothetical protein VIU11_04900, partial [Nakamurella sp.]
MPAAAQTIPRKNESDKHAGGPAQDLSGRRKKKHLGLFRDYLVQALVAAWMNTLILAVVVTAVVTAVFLPSGTWPDQSTWAVSALKVAIQLGVRVGGSHGPVVNSSVSASSLSL